MVVKTSKLESLNGNERLGSQLMRYDAVRMNTEYFDISLISKIAKLRMQMHTHTSFNPNSAP